MLHRLRYLLGMRVVVPTLQLVVRGLTRVGRLPRAHGIKFVSCVGETERLQARVAEALQLLEQVDTDLYQTARVAWAVIMVRPLSEAGDARWVPGARSLEISPTLAQTTPLALRAIAIAEQAALVRLWARRQPRTGSDARAVREEAHAYALWFADQLAPELVQEALAAGAS